MLLTTLIKPGHCRVTSPLVLNPKDGSVLVHVPAGVFEMGDAEDSDGPKHKVELSAYWIGVNAVTNAQYAAFCRATGKTGPIMASKPTHPVVYVNWHDATAYAEWAGCALPTEAEWEKAAKGPLGLNYPWGKDYNRDLCRNFDNRGSEDTARVSAYPKGVSGYGTYQQSGNVWEWCRDWYEEGFYGKSPAKDPKGPASGSARVNRGGSWYPGEAGDFRAGHRLGHDPGNRLRSFQGFRLVRAV